MCFVGVGACGLVDDSESRGRPLELAVAVCDFLDDFCEQLVSLGGAFDVVDDVAEAEFQRTAGHGERDDGFQRWVYDLKIVADNSPGNLRFDQVFADRLFGHAQKHFAGELTIAGGGEEDFNFVPDELKALRIVKNGPFQNGAIGDAHEAAVVQIVAHPVPCFHQSGAQEADVDDVAASAPDLNSVSHGVQLRKADGESAGDTGEHVLKSDRDACADDTDGKAEAGQAILKQDTEEKNNREVAAKDHELANFIACVGASKMPGQRSFEDAKRAIDNDDSDNRGNTLSQERKCHYLF